MCWTRLLGRTFNVRSPARKLRDDVATAVYMPVGAPRLVGLILPRVVS